MLPYYVMLGVPILMNFLYGRKSENLNAEKRQKIVIGTFFAILLLLLSLRGKNVGIDLSQYLPSFKRVSNMTMSEVLNYFEEEKGFWILNKIISYISTNQQIFLTIVALISVLPLVKLYSKETENGLLTMSIFIVLSNYDMLFSGLRQVIALALVAWAFKYVKEKKLIKFILIILLAFTFHKSALIALLIYPFYHLNITRGRLLLFTPFIALVFVYNKEIFEFLLEFLGDYADNYKYEETGAFTMILLFALFVAFSYIIPDEAKMDKNSKGIRNICVLAFVLQIFALASPVAMRMNYYFIMFYPLLIPKVINRTTEKNKLFYQWTAWVMTIFFIGYYINVMNNGRDILHLYPYKFFWNN